MHDATPHISVNTTSYNSSLILLLKSYKWWISGTLLGQIIAILALVILPETYEAQLLFRVGQTANEPIEPAANTVQRMKSLGFQEDIVRLIIKAHPDYVPEKIFNEINKVSINLIKNTDLIDIRVTAPSAVEAIERGKYYMDTIEKRHQTLAAPMLKMQQEQLLYAQERLKKINDSQIPNINFTRKTSSSSTSSEAINEVGFWSQEVAKSRQSLTSPNTRSSSLVEPITAPQDPISPKKIILLLFGSMIGFGLGLISFVVHSRKPLNI